MPAKKPKAAKRQPKPKIQPLGDRVLVREIDEKIAKTESGIFIPDSANSDKGAKRGAVVAVGSGKYENGKLVPISVKAGDMVLYGWGDQIEVGGEKFTLVRENEISAILN